MSGPSGAPAPTFSANNSNAASTTVATVYQAGDYTFKVVVWDPALLDLPTPPVNSTAPYVTFNQTPSTLTITGGSAFATTLGAGQNYWLDAAINDQFGNYIVETGDPIHWSSAGVTNPDGAGLNVYTTDDGTDIIQITAPPTLGSFNVDGSISFGGTINSNVITGTVVGPTVTTAAAATVSDSVKGAAPYVTLNTLGADLAGESTLTYSWSVTEDPSHTALDYAIEPSAVLLFHSPIAAFQGSLAGVSPPVYNNGLNNAKSIYAFMNTCGYYDFTCTVTDAGGNTATTTVLVYVAQKLTTLNFGDSGTSSGTYPATGSLYSVFSTTHLTYDLDSLNYVAEGNWYGPNPAFSTISTFADQFGQAMYSMTGITPTWTLGGDELGYLWTSGDFETYNGPYYPGHSGTYDTVECQVTDGYGNALAGTLLIQLT